MTQKLTRRFILTTGAAAAVLAATGCTSTVAPTDQPRKWKPDMYAQENLPALKRNLPLQVGEHTDKVLRDAMVRVNKGQWRLVSAEEVAGDNGGHAVALVMQESRPDHPNISVNGKRYVILKGNIHVFIDATGRPRYVGVCGNKIIHAIILKDIRAKQQHEQGSDGGSDDDTSVVEDSPPDNPPGTPGDDDTSVVDDSPPDNPPGTPA